MTGLTLTELSGLGAIEFSVLLSPEPSLRKPCRREEKTMYPFSGSFQLRHEQTESGTSLSKPSAIFESSRTPQQQLGWPKAGRQMCLKLCARSRPIVSQVTFTDGQLGSINIYLSISHLTA